MSLLTIVCGITEIDIFVELETEIHKVKTASIITICMPCACLIKRNRIFKQLIIGVVERVPKCINNTFYFWKAVCLGIFESHRTVIAHD